MLVGGLVTSTGSALAVPDWPLSFGQFFPPMVGGVFYEHGHRLIAAAVGFLTIVLAVWLWKASADPFLIKAGWIAVGLVITQGVLGGATVLLRLPAVTSIAHACLGQMFFAWMCCVAAALFWPSFPQAVGGNLSSKGVVDSPPAAAGNDVKRLRRLALMTTGFIFLQLLFGAIYRHTGRMLPVHFLGAALVLVHGALLYRRILESLPRDVWLTRLASLLVGLIFLQIGLGLYAWQSPRIFSATAHVGVGALVLASSAVITLQFYRRFAPV